MESIGKNEIPECLALGIRAIENNSFNYFLNTQTAIIFSEEFFAYFLGNKKDGDAKGIIKRLYESMPIEKKGCYTVIKSLEKCAISKNNFNLIGEIFRNYQLLFEQNTWKKCITDDSVSFLEECFELFIRVNRWNEFKSATQLLWKVRNATFNNGGEVVAPYKEIFSSLCTKGILEKVVQYQLFGSDEQKAFSDKVMFYFGEEGMLYLLHRLVFSPSKEDRLQLLHILKGYGEDVLSVLKKFLKEDLPWYAIRNLIILVANTENPDTYRLIEGYLLHHDRRIQEQVVAAIFQLGGETMGRRIFQALPVVGDEVKRKIVLQLSSFSDEELGKELVDFLKRRIVDSEPARDELTISIVIVLRSYPFDSVIEGLQEILDDLPQNSAHLSALQEIIIETLQILIPRQKHIAKNIETVSFHQNVLHRDMEGGHFDEDSMAAFLDVVDEEIEINGVESGTAMLLEKSVKTAYDGAFDVAEELCDKVLEINPNALHKVLEVIEIISKKRSLRGGIEEETVWHDLRGFLGDEYWRVLQKMCCIERFSTGEDIVCAGDIDPCLFLINEGQVSVSCNSNGNKIFLEKLGSGGILGVEPFFSSSVWTVDLTASWDSELMVLHKRKFNTMFAYNSALEKKLYEYAIKKENTKQLVMMSGSDRRDTARIRKRMRIYCFLYDVYRSEGTEKRVAGQLIDLSRGGMACSVKIASRAAADKMLGRQIALKFGKEKSDLFHGVIVAVKSISDKENVFSLHIRFYRVIESDLQSVLEKLEQVVVE